MFYTLGDGMVLLPGDDGEEEWTVRYHEEMPVDYFNKQYAAHHRLMWVFGFDGQHRTLTESLSKGTGFEPWIWHWPPATGAEAGAAPTRAEVFRMTEQLHTDWSGDFFSFSLKRWLFSKIDMVSRGRERKRDEYLLRAIFMSTYPHSF